MGESFHPMGLRPANPPTPSTGALCNPGSVGKRFSFTMPSGKKWTLSTQADAEARAFYCSGTSGKNIVCPDGFDTGIPIAAKPLIDPCAGRTGPLAQDAIRCPDGSISNVRAGCPTPSPLPVPVAQPCPPGQAYYGGIVAKGTRLGPGCFNPADYQAQYNQLLGIQVPEMAPTTPPLLSYYCGSWADAMRQKQGVCYDRQNIGLPECQRVIQKDQADFESQRSQFIQSGLCNQVGISPTFPIR